MVCNDCRRALTPAGRPKARMSGRREAALTVIGFLAVEVVVIAVLYLPHPLQEFLAAAGGIVFALLLVALFTQRGFGSGGEDRNEYDGPYEHY